MKKKKNEKTSEEKELCSAPSYRICSAKAIYKPVPALGIGKERKTKKNQQRKKSTQKKKNNVHMET